MNTAFPMLANYNPDYSTRDKDSSLRRESTFSTTKSEVGVDPISFAGGSTITEEPERVSFESGAYRKLVFTDPVAFRYLEEDQSTHVLDRRHKLEGYELYVVEQWVVSRTHPTFTICTYTGDLSHSILVNVLAVPDDQSVWSKRLRIYFEGISQSFAREKETHLGLLMVTNLSNFPSSLNVISVPDGDVRRHRHDFIVNEDLKRMGCAGRAAMGLHYPQASTITKFHHMYRTSEKVPLYSSVMELVRFCQVALVLYGKLDVTYADGLLCDITEKAINEWWDEIGVDFLNVEPSDGILGATTVSALIGLMVGAYNRLKEAGAPVSKDPLDISYMKKAIGYFQKTNKMDRTRRLDRATLDRLHRVTANKVEDEGLAVTRALKSTVAGLGGKGGEMIARGFGAGKEKAGIAEVETLDIERLSQLVTGKSMKWLWQGKSKGSSLTADQIDELNGRVFSTDDQGNFIWTSGNQREEDYANGVDLDEREKRGSKFRDVVGLSNSKAAHSTRSEDETHRTDHLNVPTRGLSYDPLSQRSSRSSTSEFPHLTLNTALADAPVADSQTEKAKATERIPNRGERSNTNLSAHRQALRGLDHRERESPTQKIVREQLSGIKEQLKDNRYQNFTPEFKLEQPHARGLRRSRSAIQLRNVEGRQNRLPRTLSFSIMLDAMEMEDYLGEESEGDDGKWQRMPVRSRLKIRKDQLRRSSELGIKIFNIDRTLFPFVETRIRRVEFFSDELSQELEELNSVYYQHLEEYQTLQATSTDLIAREKTSLTEAMRSIDLLGQKLDYEIDSLQSRMQEVEESVDDFERQVLAIEDNVKTLVADRAARRQPSWYERLLGSGFSKRLSQAPSKSEATKANEAVSADLQSVQPS